MVLISNFGHDNSNGSVLCRVGNGSVDTGTNYSFTEIYGDGTSASSQRSANAANFRLDYGIGGATTVTANNIAHFMNYSNTTTYKTLLVRENIPSSSFSGTGALVESWRSTSAINIIQIYNKSTYNFIAGSTFTLYGIASA